MQNATKPTTIQVAMPSASKTPRRHTGVWGHLPTVAKCVIIVPITMALLGAEIELRVAPQLGIVGNVLIVWFVWSLLPRSTPPMA